jgi:hypothetical protein
MLHQSIISALLFLTVFSTSLSAISLGEAAAMLPGQKASSTQSATQAVAGTDLTSLLVSQLGVSDKQASGGAGSILNYAKGALSADDFSKVASSIPGIDTLLSAVPSAGGGLGGVASALGGGSLGGMAALASHFSSLGLNADMVQKFMPVILDYVKGTGGSDVMSLLSGLF